MSQPVVDPSAPAQPGEPDERLSLQRRYAPHNACFGCGPANAKGLRLQSFVAPGDVTPREVVATFQPEAHHEAFPGVLNGGIIGALLDCHSAWTAAHALMLARGVSVPPCIVTAEFHVKLRAPTPTNVPVSLTARSVQLSGGSPHDSRSVDRCTVDAELSCGGKPTATCRGTFVAVKEGHPAYHRW